MFASNPAVFDCTYFIFLLPVGLQDNSVIDYYKIIHHVHYFRIKTALTFVHVGRHF